MKSFQCISVLVASLFAASQAGYWSTLIQDGSTLDFTREALAPQPGAYVNKICSRTGARVDNMEPFWTDGTMQMLGNVPGGGLSCGVVFSECFNKAQIYIDPGSQEVLSFRFGTASNTWTKLFGPATTSTVLTTGGAANECVTGIRMLFQWWGGGTTDIMKGIQLYMETSADVCSTTGLGLSKTHACECVSSCAGDASYCNALGFVTDKLGSPTVTSSQCPDNLDCCCNCPNCPVPVGL